MNMRVPLQEVPNVEALSEDNVLVVTGDLNLARRYTELQLTNGQTVRLPTDVLLSGMKIEADKDHYQVASSVLDGEEQSLVVPLVEEQLTVAKRTLTTGIVRLHHSMQEYQQALNETLAVRTIDVERVVLNQVVDTVPEIREEGDTTIYPITEERLLLTKELVLKEELRVTKRVTSTPDTQVVTLRKEHIRVERIPSESEPS